MADSTVRKYGVGRDRKLIGQLFDTPEKAVQDLAWFEGQMKSVGLEPDVRVMYVDVVTKVTAPKVWTPPKDEAADPTPPLPGEDAAAPDDGAPDAPPAD